MHEANITPVVLSGGSGTRLWPLSRKSLPKQFVPLISNKSLFLLTLERLKKFSDSSLIVSAEDHRFMVTSEMETAGIGGDIILEPCARNTAAAICLAALHAADHGQKMLLFCPSDHHIADADAFALTIQEGIIAAENGAIVTFGIHPTFPSSAYGYIRIGKHIYDDVHKVAQFVEKPEYRLAQQLILSGDSLWNAGIFLCKTSTILAALEQHAPDILNTCKLSMLKADVENFSNSYRFIRPSVSNFEKCRSESIDRAVMEIHADVAVVKYDGHWSDVGSWNMFAELYEPDNQGNKIIGHGVAFNSSKNLVYSTDRLVVINGVEDLMVIDTPDAVLIGRRDQSESVKDVVYKLEIAGHPESSFHRKVHRPWGWYDSLDTDDSFQVKRICVKPGASLSLQKHSFRAEHWVVIKGIAEVTKGDTVFTLHSNESVYISKNEIHRLKNPSDDTLEIIEVQTGTYIGEDDIVRIEDNYGRSILKA